MFAVIAKIAFINNIPVCVYTHRCMHAMHAKLLQSCPTLCNSIDGSPPGSSVPGIPQARILEWVAISFYEATITLIPKPDKESTKKRKLQANITEEHRYKNP